MAHRVDPRTGMIIQGDRRPIRPPSNHPAKRYNRETVIIEQQSSMDLSTIMAMAREIGKTIAAEIKGITPQHVVIQSGSVSQLTEQTVHIDESIADVGLDNINQLKKGEGSAIITKAETQVDSALSQSKSKLQALKGKS